MARQQYYSRVPSRLSLYNRTDGPDTFACSEGLSRDFVEKELSAICNYKPTSGEGTLIRNASLPPIYYQGQAKSGEIFQGRICFLPLDYTGERSSHIAHNIVLSPEESDTLFSAPDSVCLDASMFDGDENKFDFSDPSLTFDSQYPDFPITVRHSDHAVDKLKSFSSEAVKRLLLSMILTACGKYKSVLLSVAVGIEDFSSELLSVMNAALQVIPYQFRPYISFSTYCSDASAASRFAFRGIPVNYIDNKPVKGVYLNLSTSRFAGISDADAQANAAVVNFLYELVKNDQARRIFLSFYDHVAKHFAGAAKPNLKSLTDIIFIFRLCSSVTLDKSVPINDDSLVNLFTLYDKYRSALPDEYRVEAARHLRYYADTYTAIPKPLFAKLSKVYPAEPSAVKKLIIDLVFDLFHTDIMRDKLFVFLKNNYDDESPEIRAQILDNLMRVFYGGFLQRQILAFFEEKFPTADEASQDAIVEKLLLSVRTKDIGDEIIAFFNQHFDLFSPKSKQAFFKMFLALLPDADALTAKILPIADARFPELEEDVQNDFREKLIAVADKESRKSGDAFLAVFFENDNRFLAMLEEKIMTGWQGRKVFNDYLHLLAKKDLAIRTEKVVGILERSPEVTSELTEKIIQSQVGGHIATLWPVVVINSDAKIRGTFIDSPDPVLKAFPNAWFRSILVPYLMDLVDHSFKGAPSAQELQRLTEYYHANKIPIPDEKEKIIRTVVAFDNAYRAGDTDSLCALYPDLPTDKKWSVTVYDFLTRTLLSETGETSQNELLLRIILSYYKTGSFDLSKRLNEALARDKRDKETAVSETSERLLTAACLAYDRLPVPNGFLNEKLGVSWVVNSFVNAVPKKNFAQLSDIIERLPSQKPDFPDFCRRAMKEIKKQQGNFLSRLFGKK